MFGISYSVIEGLIGNGGFLPDGGNALDGSSLQQQCAQQAQTAAVRSMMRQGWLNPTLAYLMRNTVPPPPLDEPKRTLFAGRPWMDVQ